MCSYEVLNRLSSRTFAVGKFVRDKEHCNVGTIGHVDHGKMPHFFSVQNLLPTTFYDFEAKPL